MFAQATPYNVPLSQAVAVKTSMYAAATDPKTSKRDMATMSMGMAPMG